MNNKIKEAISYFDNGFNCAQSVVSSFCDDLNIDKETALKLSTGFGGGMGRKGEVCGAVTGGIFVLGAKYGNGFTVDEEKTNTTHSKTSELMEFISQKHKTYLCKELKNNPEIAEEDVRDKVCKSCISDVVEKLQEIL